MKTFTALAIVAFLAVVGVFAFNGSANARPAKYTPETCKTVTLNLDGSVQYLCKNDFTVPPEPTDTPTGP